MAKRRCNGTTKRGAPCRSAPLNGASHCAAHAPSTDRTDRTPKRRARDWAPRFLEALQKRCMVTEAARAAGMARSTVYERRECDEEFAAAWDEIVERTTEEMEAEAYRRAVEGWTERSIVDAEGNEVEVVRKFSDTLLIFMLKARRPTVYRERVEHTGAGGGPIEHRAKLDLSRLSDEQLAALEAIQPHAAGADED